MARNLRRSKIGFAGLRASSRTRRSKSSQLSSRLSRRGPSGPLFLAGFRSDAAELETLQNWVCRVEGFIQNSPIEVEPAKLAVEQAWAKRVPLFGRLQIGCGGT